MRKKNYFIAFDGIDGIGKSTLIQKVKEYLTEKGHDVVVYGNPGGGTDSALAVRQVVFGHNIKKGADLFYINGCQFELWQQIKEDLAMGKTVLVDRWTMSAMAYQHGVTGISRNTMNTFYTLLNALRKEFELPNADLHVWLHADFDLIKSRIRNRTDKSVDKYETLTEAWFDNVQGSYKYIYDSVKLEKNKRLTKVSYWGECYGIDNLAEIKVTEETTPESNLQQVIQDLEMI